VVKRDVLIKKNRNAMQAELTLAEGIYKGRNVVNK
jgi:hypothetical protein